MFGEGGERRIVYMHQVFFFSLGSNQGVLGGNILEGNLFFWVLVWGSREGFLHFCVKGQCTLVLDILYLD